MVVSLTAMLSTAEHVQNTTECRWQYSADGATGEVKHEFHATCSDPAKYGSTITDIKVPLPSWYLYGVLVLPSENEN
jgi:hypothetical protein